ncbi:MAG: methyltransferase domain-containing protein [Alphaproteobacteria bacterium]|nr:methyltransferase domain-containing protein [Alphaproteobacteria bacterium]
MAAPASTSFKELEREGWSTKAEDYDSFAGQITRGAVAPLLDSTAVRAGMDVLDVACGPGYIAAAAAERGANALGVDFSASMVAEARRRFPAVAFSEGDAENLAFDPASFDAVVCGFGLLHIADPDRAIAEACRVLRPGGRYAFTVWMGLDRHDFFKLVTEVMQAHANMDVGLPPAPPMFRFSDPAECRGAMQRAGLRNVTVAELPLVWRARSAGAVLEFLKKSAVRLGMILDRQAPEVRERIYREVFDGAERFRGPDGYHVAWPAVLAVAQKP